MAPTTLPALVLALSQAAPASAGLAPLLAAAARVAPASPGYWTAQYHLARLTPDPGTTLRIVDHALEAAPDRLSIQDRNLFKRLALPKANTVASLARYLPRANTMPAYAVEPFPTFDRDVARLLNAGLTLDQMVRVLHGGQLPQPLRQQLLVTVWTRAFVLDRWDVMRQLAPAIRRTLPRSAAALIDAMLAAPDQHRRKAIGALLLARYPGMTGNVPDVLYLDVAWNEIALPNMSRGLAQQGARKNWWCGLPVDTTTLQRRAGADAEPEPKPVVETGIGLLSPAQAATLRRERLQLIAASDGTDYLARIVLSWAATAPRDPRLRQALVMLYRSSKGGCVEAGDNLALLRQHLVKYFPGSLSRN
jgi:hypothetical protein